MRQPALDFLALNIRAAVEQSISDRRYIDLRVTIANTLPDDAAKRERRTIDKRPGESIISSRYDRSRQLRSIHPHPAIGGVSRIEYAGDDPGLRLKIGHAACKFYVREFRGRRARMDPQSVVVPKQHRDPVDVGIERMPGAE